MDEYYDEDEEYNLQHQAQTANIMDQFGRGADQVGNLEQRRKEQRIKRGECPNCRRKTHKVSRFPFGKGGKNSREPLTIEGEVENGHCLRCNPVDSYNIPRGPEIPDMLYVYEDEDNMTVATDITMDPYLTTAESVKSGTGSSKNSSRPSLNRSARSGSGRFEAVSEENEMTEFEQYEQEMNRSPKNNRRRRKKQQQPSGKRGGRIIEADAEDESEGDNGDEESEDSESWTEDHEKVIRHMEEQRKLSSSNFSNSDPSMSASDGDFNASTRTGDRTEHTFMESRRSSNSTDGKGQVKVAMGKHTFHPLAHMAQLYKSENSMSLQSTGEISHTSQSEAASVQSSDSDRINRLCQGSRSSMYDVEDLKKSPRNEKQSSVAAATTSTATTAAKSPQRKQRERSEKNRFSLARLSIDEGAKGAKKLPHLPNNRRSTVDMDTKRKAGVQNEGNRFSLTNPRPGQQPMRQFNSSALSQELDASKNWDSTDILRDAAAEANGVDLDAKIDAMFGLPKSMPTKQIRETVFDSMISKSSSEELDEEDDDVNNMIAALTQFSSANQEEAIATTITQRRQSLQGPKTVQLSTIKDIPVILQTVKSKPNDQKCIERAFQSLFLLATDPDPEGRLARQVTMANDGMETLVLAIWHHMQSTQVILALFQALWAISADDESSSSDTLSIGKLLDCRALEGILFAMQQHATDMNIQESGCDLITRMTEKLPFDTPDFKLLVLLLSKNIQGMGTNTKAYSSCLDALNALCQLSSENKVAFAKAGNDCHNAIIRGLMSSECPSLDTRELACELFWCVTADRNAASAISPDSLLSKQIIDALKSVPRTKASVHFFASACGTLANLGLDQDNHSKMINLAVVQVLCEAIYVYDFSEDVISAACTALANLSSSKDVRDDMVSQGSLPALLSAMKATSNNVNIQSEVFRALNNLSETSLDGKLAIVSDLELIITTYFRHDGVKYMQQVTMSILNWLSSDYKCRKSMITTTTTFNALAKIMKANPTKKMVLKTACSALGNVSKEEEIIPILLSKGFTALVIDAMDAYPNCEELQENACNFLMNMGSNGPEATIGICSGEGVQCLVRAMQAFPTTATLQQASCRALCSISKGPTPTIAEAHKDMLLATGAAEVIIYALLVHPTDMNVIEHAMNVLASLSSSRKGTKTIADAGGISTVIETMKVNPSSTDIIPSGARFVQSMALADLEYANECVGAIAPILFCMNEHPDCQPLIEDSCKALRCLVLKSESCKDRVITANGVAIIEKTRRTASQRWQTLLLDELFATSM